MWNETNNGVLVETVGSAVPDFRNEQCTYWFRGNYDADKAMQDLWNATYETSLIWQIDVNITALSGVTAQIMNGTSFFSAGDGIEVNEENFKNGKSRFTFNVTFNVSETEYDDFGITDEVRDSTPVYRKGGDYVTAENNIFVTFTALPGIT